MCCVMMAEDLALILTSYHLISFILFPHSWTDISDDCIAVFNALCGNDAGMDMFTSSLSE